MNLRRPGPRRHPTTPEAFDGFISNTELPEESLAPVGSYFEHDLSELLDHPESRLSTADRIALTLTAMKARERLAGIPAISDPEIVTTYKPITSDHHVNHPQQ